jgi:hypothetical protein
MAKLHPNHPTLRNPKWSHQVFDNARAPKAWMHVAGRLRASADAIFERERPVTARQWDELRRISRLAAASVDKFWPMGADGSIKAGGYRWPDSINNILAYYDALEAELRDHFA